MRIFDKSNAEVSVPNLAYRILPFVSIVLRQIRHRHELLRPAYFRRRPDALLVYLPYGQYPRGSSRCSASQATSREEMRCGLEPSCLNRDIVLRFESDEILIDLV